MLHVPRFLGLNLRLALADTPQGPLFRYDVLQRSKLWEHVTMVKPPCGVFHLVGKINKNSCISFHSRKSPS